MKQISNADYQLIKNFITIVSTPLKHTGDRKIINAVRRANLMLNKFQRNEEKESKNPHP